MDNAELFRLLCNLIRTGTVTDTDFTDTKNPRVRVTTGGNVTGWIRWMTTRAGSARRWCAPAVGEQVILAVTDGDNDLNNAVVLGSLFGSDFPPPASSDTTDMIVWSDGATCCYDTGQGAMTVSGIKALTVTAGGPATINCTTAMVKADDSITLDAPEVTCTHKLSAAELSVTEGGEMNGAFTGSLTINGVKPDSHSHGGVESGGSWTKGTQ